MCIEPGESLNLLAASVHWTCFFSVKLQQVAEQRDAKAQYHKILDGQTEMTYMFLLTL